jgi:hypothetical protein
MFNFKEGGKRIWHIALLLYYFWMSFIIYDHVKYTMFKTHELFYLFFALLIPFILKLIFTYIIKGFKKK